jgi:3-dehydroquinate synthase
MTTDAPVVAGVFSVERLENVVVETVRVNLAERSYDIQIGAGNLAEAGRFLSERAKVTHVVLITDEHVQKPHAMRVAESFGEQEIQVDVISVEPGEESKSLDVAASLWQGLLELGADRKTIVTAVGGGVVGDLAGFIAATYARGLRFLQMPTSLLAQVDSSVGGKVGINLPDAKNMIGAFLQPLGVMIDTATLATLPANEYRAGLAEVVKYGVILDAEFFQYLESNVAAANARQAEVLAQVISRCCRLKADVVEKDEREESGLRAVLNFGHTFAHAFEALSGYGKLLHGEAVGMGMVCAARLAERLGRVDAQFTSRLGGLLRSLGVPVEVPHLNAQKVLDAMMHDKKVQHGRLSFVLPSRLGQVELVGNIAPADVRAALKNK